MKKIINYIRNNIDLLLGLIFILYFICLIYLSYLKIKYVFLMIGVVFIIYHFFKDKIKKRKNMYNVLKRLFIIFMSVFIIIESTIIFYPKYNLKESEYIIVLGALVNKTRLSKTLKDRLDAAIYYLDKIDKDTYIIVSGGKGNGENISEADAMYNYLVENNVSPKYILKEDKSTTTDENFKYSKTIIENHSNKDISDVNIKIVTTDFHAFRSSLMARRYGYKDFSFYTSKSKYYLIPLNYFREFCAIIQYIAFNM